MAKGSISNFLVFMSRAFIANRTPGGYQSSFISICSWYSGRQISPSSGVSFERAILMAIRFDSFVIDAGLVGHTLKRLRLRPTTCSYGFPIPHPPCYVDETGRMPPRMLLFQVLAGCKGHDRHTGGAFLLYYYSVQGVFWRTFC